MMRSSVALLLRSLTLVQRVPGSMPGRAQKFVSISTHVIITPWGTGAMNDKDVAVTSNQGNARLMTVHPKRASQENKGTRLKIRNNKNKIMMTMMIITFNKFYALIPFQRPEFEHLVKMEYNQRQILDCYLKRKGELASL